MLPTQLGKFRVVIAESSLALLLYFNMPLASAACIKMLPRVWKIRTNLRVNGYGHCPKKDPLHKKIDISDAYYRNHVGSARTENFKKRYSNKRSGVSLLNLLERSKKTHPVCTYY